MRFIGDVHAKFSKYLVITEDCDESIQVGDFGVGFGIEAPVNRLGHKFIRGNHDNREECYQHPNYLGDYGLLYPKVFFAGGAFSVDRSQRTAGINWWPDEELSQEQRNKAFKIYKEAKPWVVISHCCPRSIQEEIFDFPYLFDNNSIQWFDLLLETHKPKLWVFGHYHQSRDVVVDGCRFVCLKELEYKDINIREYVAQN